MGCGYLIDLSWLLNRGFIKETNFIIELWNQCHFMA